MLVEFAGNFITSYEVSILEIEYVPDFELYLFLLTIIITITKFYGSKHCMFGTDIILMPVWDQFCLIIHKGNAYFCITGCSNTISPHLLESLVRNSQL